MSRCNTTPILERMISFRPNRSHFKRMRPITQALLLLPFLSSCSTAPRTTEPTRLSTPRFGGPRYFIASFDGSSPRDLYTLLDQGFLVPKGTLSHIKAWARADRALPVGITLTAPSHVSISTCASPDVHGIPANSFLRNGEEVSGFESEIFAETSWEAAQKQGRKVLSVGFIGADGRSPRRQASAGLAYPKTEFLGKAVLLPIQIRQLQALNPKHWVLEERFKRQRLFESQVEILVNSATQEKKLLFLLWQVRSPKNFTVLVDEDQDTTNGIVGELNSKKFETEFLDLIWKETDPKSPLFGRKRRSLVSLLRSPARKDDFALFISKPNYNNAYPAEFLEFLESENLVWVDKGFPDMLESGGRMSPLKYLSGLSVQNNLLAEAVFKAQAKWDFDMIQFYQPLVDSFQHAYFALQPEITTHNLKNNPVLQGVLRAYETVLANTERLFSTSSPNDVLVITGDHGMEPVTKMVNAFALVGHPPAGMKLLVSGGILLVYENINPPEESLQARQTYVMNLLSQLRGLHFDGKPVAKGLYLKKENPQGWIYGDALAAIHSAAGFWIHFKPEVPRLLIEPPLALGMHGHESDHQSMSTIYLSRDPRLGGRRFSTIDLRDVTPTAFASVGMRPPKQCQGRDLAESP